MMKKKRPKDGKILNSDMSEQSKLVQKWLDRKVKRARRKLE